MLESPTGTGKTLSILCAALAWQRDRTEDLKRNVEKQQRKKVKGPQIVYASRTHSQLTQVIKELKTTSYRPRLSVLGSRQQLCVNPEVVSASTQTARRNLCDMKVKERKCSYFLKTENYSYYSSQQSNRITSERLDIQTENVIRDIEDLCSLGKRERVCPYVPLSLSLCLNQLQPIT